MSSAVLSRWRRSVLRQFSKVGHTWRRPRRNNQGAALYAMAPYGQAVFFCFDGFDGFDDNLDQISGDGMSIAVLSRWRRPACPRPLVSKVGHKWRRTRGTHGRRHSLLSFCRPEEERGQPSSGRWRHENAAGEAAERISALSGIGAGTNKSMAMAAGEDDADNSSPGGFLTCSASV
jgi:hypothetical protein